jgi:hypothetical protein
MMTSFQTNNPALKEIIFSLSAEIIPTVVCDLKSSIFCVMISLLLFVVMNVSVSSNGPHKTFSLIMGDPNPNSFGFPLHYNFTLDLSLKRDYLLIKMDVCKTKFGFACWACSFWGILWKCVVFVF